MSVSKKIEIQFRAILAFLFNDIPLVTDGGKATPFKIQTNYVNLDGTSHPMSPNFNRNKFNWKIIRELTDGHTIVARTQRRPHPQIALFENKLIPVAKMAKLIDKWFSDVKIVAVENVKLGSPPDPSTTVSMRNHTVLDEASGLTEANLRRMVQQANQSPASGVIEWHE